MPSVPSLCCLIALALCPTERAPAREELGALFQRAELEPAALVPLIERASARIGEVERRQARALADRLEPFCARAFFGPERFEGMERLGLAVHAVASGENPSTIAARYRVSPGLLARLNPGLEPRALRVGQELKVLDLRGAELRLVVDLEGFRLSAWRRAQAGGALLVLQAPVGLGAPETPTPAGTTRVVERALDPEWRHPVTNVVYPPGHPENILGGYWIRLAPEGIERTGIGLHGYTAEEPGAWLERRASNGCVRMRQDDVDRVFHLALEGTPVWLVP
jgi:lipoprotein-anchoring transpeptidase ErfK/SrfK